jgi:transposase-like protein
MPVDYSPELAAAICARIAAGESTYGITRSPGMPNRRTLYKWRARHPGFATQYDAARRASFGRARTGRPTDYSPALADAICNRILEGATVNRACRAEGMPTHRTVFVWLARHPEFARQYAVAKILRAHVLADEMLEIADDDTLDVTRQRQQIDARKWLVARMELKKYRGR